eukprot:jgi/Galph1/3501/GphlegSOOS_G2175.1
MRNIGVTSCSSCFVFTCPVKRCVGFVSTFQRLRYYTSRRTTKPKTRRVLETEKIQTELKNIPRAALKTPENIVPTELGDEVSKSYLEYALSVILGRAIPDARDGLKPVHRRILYGMHKLGLASEGPFRKCARVVGEVLGKYHPHGDSAVYEALVRMAQTFVMRICLVDGHGNFGSVDHDPPAAMRYTECRLATFTQATLLDDLDKNTVPNLLLNGSSGIAVGMATNIPPHNLNELCYGLIAMIENPNISLEELIRHVRGPDFPTGGIIMGKQGIENFYKTGRGSITIRAKTHIENISHQAGRPGRQAIVVTELPYAVNKATLVANIAQLVQSKKLDGIVDVRDESDREGIRMVVELKRGTDAQVVLHNLFKWTALQTNFAANMLAVYENRPRRMSLREYFRLFLDFRVQVVRKRCEFELAKAKERRHLLDGFLLVLSHVDQVVSLIKSSSDYASAKVLLTGVGQESSNASSVHPLPFQLTEKQAESILSMQLRRLTQLESQRLYMEQAQLRAQIEDLEDILQREDRIFGIIVDELKTCASRFGSDRRTDMSIEEGILVEQSMVPNEKSIILTTCKNFMKRMPFSEFEAQHRGTKGKIGITVRQEESIQQMFACRDHDTMLMSSESGKLYSIPIFQIPLDSRTSRGNSLKLVLPNMDSAVSCFLPVSSFSKEEYLVMVTKNGYIKRCPLSLFESINKAGKFGLHLESDKLLWISKCKENDWILLATKQGKVVMFPVNSGNLRICSRNARGARAIKLRPGDELRDMDVFSVTTSGKKDAFFLAVTKRGRGKRVQAQQIPSRKRNQHGVLVIKFSTNEPDDELSCFRFCRSMDVLFCTNKGRIVRQSVKDIPIQSRQAKGVVVQRLEEDEWLATLAIPSFDESIDVSNTTTIVANEE